MASDSTKKSQSSRTSILWLPGRKSHSKDHSNHISYSGPQKKGEMSSLEGSKAQSELTDLPFPDLPGEGNVHVPLSLSGKSESGSSTDGSLAIVSETATVHATRLLTYFPNLGATSTPSTRAMTSNVTTTAEIQDFPKIKSPENLPKVPTATAEAKRLLNSSVGTMTQGAQDLAHSQLTTPQKIKCRNHNNQEDINSIESISSVPSCQGNTFDFDWIDEMVEQRKRNEMMHKNKQQKASNKDLAGSLQPGADQLDGQRYNFNSNDKDNVSLSKGNDSDDDLVVKCLYYSIMCCDCRIS